LCDKLIRTYPLILGPDKVDREQVIIPISISLSISSQLLDLLKLLLSQANENPDSDPIASLVDLNKADDVFLLDSPVIIS
jgi:hypothetical protein